MTAINAAKYKQKAMYTKQEASTAANDSGSKDKKSNKFDSNQLKYDSRLYHTFVVHYSDMLCKDGKEMKKFVSKEKQKQP